MLISSIPISTFDVGHLSVTLLLTSKFSMKLLWKLFNFNNDSRFFLTFLSIESNYYNLFLICCAPFWTLTVTLLEIFQGNKKKA